MEWSLADTVAVVMVDGGVATVSGQEGMLKGPEEGLGTYNWEG